MRDQRKLSSEEKKVRPKTLKLIRDNYELIGRIGGGSFGEVYAACDLKLKRYVAIKTEQTTTPHPQLNIERQVYEELKGEKGFSKIYLFCEEKGYYVLVMDMLGPSIEELLCFCDRRLTEKTVLMIADQMIERIATLHSHHILHRDIKPDNFVVGRFDKSHIIHVIDFGLCKQFRDAVTYEHIPFRSDRSLTGTARYASIHAHEGLEQSRRDDLEALAYVIIYLARGSLPWMGLKAESKHKKYQLIYKMKRDTPIDDLCVGIATEYGTFLNYVRSLAFDEKPDYDYIKHLFRHRMYKKNYKYDYNFDWLDPKYASNIKRVKTLFC